MTTTHDIISHSAKTLMAREIVQFLNFYNGQSKEWKNSIEGITFHDRIKVMQLCFEQYNQSLDQLQFDTNNILNRIRQASHESG